MYRKLSQRPIPGDALARLNDTSLTKIERVRFAEKCRAENEIRYIDAAKLCGVKNTQYSKIQKLLRPENADLLHEVESGRLSINLADIAIKDRSVLYGMFPPVWLEGIKAQGANIVLQTEDFCVYRKASALFLAVAARNGMRSYVFDDLPFVEHVLIDLIGRRILRKDMRLSVRGGDGVSLGAIRHHIIAAYLRIPCEKVVGCKTRQIRKTEYMGSIDYRIENIECHPFSGFFPRNPRERFVENYDGTLYIEQNGVVVLADYSPQLKSVLQKYTRHLKSRDGRLAMMVGGQDIYLYRLVVAAHRAGSLPVDADGIRDLMLHFDADTHGYEVDHLSASVNDCRLQNLMLMSTAQNKKKQTLQASLKKLCGRYYADATRHDDERVYFTAGRRGESGENLTPDVSGVFTVSEYLEQFSAFLQLSLKSSSIT